MTEKLPEYRRRALEERLSAFLEEYAVVNKQLTATLSAGDRKKIERQITNLESQIQEVERQLGPDSAQTSQNTEPPMPPTTTPSPTASPLPPVETAPPPSTLPPPTSAETTPSPAGSPAAPKPGRGGWSSRLPNASKVAVIIGLLALIFASILVVAALVRASQNVTILNLHNGDRVPYRISVLGEYPAGMKDTIRVFIAPRLVRGVPPSTFFPQSYNPCVGNAGAVMQNGQWEQQILIGADSAGDAGLRFDVVVTTATDEGNAEVVSEIQQWCDKKEWPGFTGLPAGVSEVARITVTRSDERLRAPDPSGSQLPGLVNITSPGDGQTTINLQVISGTYSNLLAGHTIWALVYATSGKWFPQSTDACAGIHTVAENGQWQVTSSFWGGQPNQPYDVVAVVANPEASAFFDQKQQEWCAQWDKSPDFSWPGLLTIELPPGITEKDRIQVVHE